MELCIIKKIYFSLSVILFTLYFTPAVNAEFFKILIEIWPLVGCVLILFDKNINILKTNSFLFFFLLIIFFILTVSNGVRRDELLVLFIIYILFSNENPKSVIRIFSITIVSFLLITTVLSSVGILPNYTHLRDVYDLTSVRRAFIFNHSNQYGLITFSAYLSSLIYLKNSNRKIKNSLFLIGLLLTGYILFYIDSKTSALCILFATLLFKFYDVLRTYNCKRIILLLNRASFLFIPLFYIFSLISTFLYDNNYAILNLLNKLLTGRIYLQNKAVTSLGIPMFGQLLTNGEAYVDSFYIQSILNYGLLPFTLIIICVSFMIYKFFKHNQLSCIFAVVFLIGIIGISEPVCLNIVVNPYLIFLMIKISQLENKCFIL